MKANDCMNRGKKVKITDAAVFVAMLIVVSAVTLILFYRQCTGNPELYHSDMKAYILEMQGLDSGYSFPYPVLFKLAAFIHLFTSPEWAVAIATMLLNSGAMVVTKVAMNHLVLSGREETKGSDGAKGMKITGGKIWERICISVIAVSLFFISMLYTPAGIYLPGIKFRYLGVFTANPFHNATYMAARPFAILAFLWFVKLLPVYERGLGRSGSVSSATTGQPGIWDYIWFSVFLLLATLAKPSFTLVMVSAAGLVMAYRMIRSGFRNFVPTVQLGLCFIPTFLDLLYQYKGVFVSAEKSEGGVGFGFGDVWSLYCDCIPLGVCLAVGFPLMVLILNFRKYKKNTLHLFAWQLFAVSFSEAFLLYEKGFRKPDFNFSWGYMYGIFFCHFGALVVLMKETAELMQERNAAKRETSKGDAARSGVMPAVLIGVQWLAYLCHLLCGLLYFRGIAAGGMYY